MIMVLQLELLWVGKGRDKLLSALVDRYVERLRRSVAVTVSSVPDVRGAGRSADEVRRLEAQRLREKLAGSERRRRAAAGRLWVVALDERGDAPDTAELADILAGLPRRGVQRACFVVGGAEGLEPAFVGEADRVLALSRMTLTHELARVVLVEQLYRACAVLSGHPYHRE